MGNFSTRKNEEWETFKVLFVDDYKTTRDVLKDWLAKEFPRMGIAEASSAKEALEKVDSYLPDLVFMDIRLPDGSGLDLTKQIKGKYPAINVVVLSSYDSSMYDPIAKRNGASRFLCKGDISRDDILDLVRSFIEIKEKK